MNGQRIPAGLGYSTVRADVDFETYSEAGYVWDAGRERWQGPPGAPKGSKGLPVVGAENYVRHPSFDIVWLAYDLKDGLGWRQWRPGLPAPADLLGYLAAGGEIEAWNVAFERWVWELHCVARLGWPAVRESQWFCAVGKARASSYPGALAKAGDVMQLTVRKDARGSALMTRLSMPRNPTATDPRLRIQPVYSEAQWRSLAAGWERYWRELDPDATTRRQAGYAGRALALATDDYADTLAYGEYNVTDIVAEAEASARVPDQPPAELEWWRCHERINRRGIHIDRAGVEDCIAVVEQVFEKYNGELLALTGIDAASKVAQIQAWLHAHGVHLDSLDEDAVSAALASGNPLPPEARRVLEIRAAAGSASIKKLYAIRNRLNGEDRLTDLLVYHAARTGRSGGEGPQPLNLPKAGPDLIRCPGGEHWHGKHLAFCPKCMAIRLPNSEVAEWSPRIVLQALEDTKTRSLAWIEHVYGDALAVIGGCLRGLFDAAAGHDLISTDYSSIEAVGLAMLAGEKWRIEVFRTHGKIYEASASAMFGVPLDEILAHRKQAGAHHPLRQKGKVAELAFGYQGWLGSAKAFDMPGTDDEIKADILRWRAASPAIEWLWGGQGIRKAATPVRSAKPDGVADWLQHLRTADRWDRSPYLFGVEGVAVLAVQEPGAWHVVYRLDGTDSGIAFRAEGATLYCRIPSGRLLTYHSVRLSQSDRGGLAISYKGWNTNPKNGGYGWVEMDTWGGRLVENIVQATCRDILAPACIAVERAGYPVVLHVYDEIVSEVPEGFGSIAEFEAIVTVPPAWAHDWPIRAPDGYRAKRYRKG